MGKISFRPCILSGGAGNRLWPFSREHYPKQFLDLVGRGKPLLVETVQRLLPMSTEISILTHEDLKFSTIGLLRRHGIAGVEVLSEPARKNTAAAIAFLTWSIFKKDPQAVLGVFPSDHVVVSPERFSAAAKLAVEKAAEGSCVVVLGIRPTSPSDAYGYVELAAAPDLAKMPLTQKAVRFVEKPSIDRAEVFLKSGKFFWNAGIFFFQAKLMASLFEKLMPELWFEIQDIADDHSNLAEVYSRLQSESIDYGIMEHLRDIECVVCDPGWSDVGSWEEVAKESKPSNLPIEINGRGNTHLILGHHKKKSAFVGVSDILLAETQDAILVLKKGDGQSVREVVKSLKKSSPELIRDHLFEERPWGGFEILLDDRDLKVKRITVLPGERLSYQSHEKRNENWTVISGEAEVTLNDEIKKLRNGDHIYIPMGAKHRVANRGKEALVFIEVQTGNYFGEDDITRFTDDYGRVKK